MKLQKLLLSAVTACLLLGVSGAAMADPDTCEDGFIVYERVSKIKIDGQPCFIHNVL